MQRIPDGSQPMHKGEAPASNNTFIPVDNNHATVQIKTKRSNEITTDEKSTQILLMQYSYELKFSGLTI